MGLTWRTHEDRMNIVARMKFSWSASNPVFVEFKSLEQEGEYCEEISWGGGLRRDIFYWIWVRKLEASSIFFHSRFFSTPPNSCPTCAAPIQFWETHSSTTSSLQVKKIIAKRMKSETTSSSSSGKQKHSGSGDEVDAAEVRNYFMKFSMRYFSSEKREKESNVILTWIEWWHAI